MKRFLGKSICHGAVFGKIFFLHAADSVPDENTEPCVAENPCRELERYEQAKAEAGLQLQELQKKTAQKVGQKEASIFEAQALLLEDGAFNECIRQKIMEEQKPAAYAVKMAGDVFGSRFSQMKDEYIQARAADIRDIVRLLLSVLTGRKTMRKLCGPVIVAAEELLPGETVQLDSEKVLALITSRGSVNSHTAILARTMGIPTVTGIPVKPEWDGHLAAVDGNSGTMILDPDEKTLEEMKGRQRQEMAGKNLLQQLKDQENVTLDGKTIPVCANIKSLEDIETVLDHGGSGIGLFRSEFLFLGRKEPPSEEEQFQIYKEAAEKMDGKKVVIRTLDLGADKTPGYMKTEPENNPAMGCRGIRVCLQQPELFRAQLRAIYRASVFGNIAILYPMITSLEEMNEICRITENIRKELTDDGLPWKQMEQGIMIETPAAAVISDLLAREVDFFSIGTNDLTQYTLAMDRDNGKLDRFFDPHHPAVLRLIAQTVENGHREGCRVSICGELGADLELTETFLQMGIDELSVAPGMILPLRKQIRSSRTTAKGRTPVDQSENFTG